MRFLGGSTAATEGTEEFAAACRAYKYVGPNLSLLERNGLERLWAALPGNVYPPWLAPNVVSLMGGGAMMAATTLMWLYSPDLDGAAPIWVYVAQAALIFAYQTLDGSDGKQARATGSGSGLGEMVDHGIDALVTASAACVVMDAGSFGLANMHTWAILGALQVVFFVSNMTLLHTGKQLINDIDVIELHWAGIATLLGTAFVPGGTAAWRRPMAPFLAAERLPAWMSDTLPYMAEDGGVSTRLFLACGCCVGIVANLAFYMYTVYRGYAGAPLYAPQRREDGTLLPGRGVLAATHQIATVLAHWALVVLCAASVVAHTGGGLGGVGAALRRAMGGAFGGAVEPAREVGLARNSLIALYVLAHVTFGDVLNRLMVTRVGYIPYPSLHWALLMLAAFAAAPAALGAAGYGAVAVTRVHEAMCALSVAMYARRTWNTASRIADALGVRFFTIEDKGGKEKGRRKEGKGRRGAPNGRVNGEAKKKVR